jgi:hypothetical protein
VDREGFLTTCFPRRHGAMVVVPRQTVPVAGTKAMASTDDQPPRLGGPAGRLFAPADARRRIPEITRDGSNPRTSAGATVEEWPWLCAALQRLWRAPVRDTRDAGRWLDAQARRGRACERPRRRAARHVGPARSQQPRTHRRPRRGHGADIPRVRVDLARGPPEGGFPAHPRVRGVGAARPSAAVFRQLAATGDRHPGGR